MAIGDCHGLPVSVYEESASPHEVTLVGQTIEARFTSDKPIRLIGDKAYDSDGLDEELKKQGIEMIAPNKENRVKGNRQDGRPLRRYKEDGRLSVFSPGLVASDIFLPVTSIMRLISLDLSNLLVSLFYSGVIFEKRSSESR